MFTIVFFIACSNCVWTQDIAVQDQSEKVEELDLAEKNKTTKEDKNVFATKKIKKPIKTDLVPKREAESLEVNEIEIYKEMEFDKYDLRKAYMKEKPFFKSSDRAPIKYEQPKRFQKGEKFHWKPAIVESLYFLGIQQAFRTIQKKTRREFKGEFINDWGRSARNLRGWRDGDSFMTNYIAHPMQGAVTGRIFLNNSDKSRKLKIGKSKEYWKSRLKAMAWSAAWSTQFELGPISEASMGNVGLYDQTGPNRMGWVDIVVTPIAGTAVVVGEDAVDKFILRKWLEKGISRDRMRIKVVRTFLTPFQAFTNVLRGKLPWHRDNR